MTTGLLLLLLSGVAWRLTAASALKIGLNFTGATYGTESFAEPPDGAIAVGSNHVVQFVNGSFSVFNKTNGAAMQRMSDLAFWSAAGVIVPGNVSDPRMVYDAASQRWFAAMVDFQPNNLVSNRFLLAVSATPDPSGAWNGVAFDGDPTNGYFADFPTLGINGAGVYLGGDMFDAFDNEIGSLIVAIPKADLLAIPPSAEGRTSSGLLGLDQYGAVLQPAVAMGSTASDECIVAMGDLGLDFNAHSNVVVTTITNASAPLGAAIAESQSISVPAYEVPINPPQPGGSHNLDDGDARLGATVYRVGDVLYAVHGTEINRRAALQWFMISATNHALIDSGTISHPTLHLFYPCIAANESGAVVLAFNGCGPNQFISAYAMMGAPVAGHLQFGDMVLLKAGRAGYRTNSFGINRWGDYSAIAVDPSDPARFWSLTSYAASTSAWATQVTELIAVPALEIARAGADVVISWPANAVGYQLQVASALDQADWQPVPQQAVTNNGVSMVVLGATNAAGFFRLAQPPGAP